MKKLYFTHCCARKDYSLKEKDLKVSPLQLYKATPTQRFMKRCLREKVEWAIFSDKYGFVFPENRINWYEKHPSTVTDAEKRELFKQAYEILSRYQIAYFYYNPGRLHPLYRELVNEIREKGRNIREITHLSQILL